jgi:pimeloyl-ACP methyl ester carboxylesterase
MLFLWREADAFAPLSTGRKLAASMPDARLEVMPGTGHLPHLEQLEKVAAAVEGFLVTGRTG